MEKGVVSTSEANIRIPKNTSAANIELTDTERATLFTHANPANRNMRSINTKLNEELIIENRKFVFS